MVPGHERTFHVTRTLWCNVTLLKRGHIYLGLERKGRLCLPNSLDASWNRRPTRFLALPDPVWKDKIVEHSERPLSQRFVGLTGLYVLFRAAHEANSNLTRPWCPPTMFIRGCWSFGLTPMDRLSNPVHRSSVELKSDCAQNGNDCHQMSRHSDVQGHR